MLRSFSRRRRGSLLAATALSAALATTGCAVRPQPLTSDEIALYSADKFARVTSDEEPVRGELSLYEAVARGVKYNLDFKVELFQTALRVKDLELANYRLLPGMAAEAGYSTRNNFAASSSRSIDTGLQSLQTSTSQQRSDLIADSAISWNVLDFGLSYVRALQAADEVLMAEEAKRKVVNRIVEDIRTAYWRAYSAQHLVEKLRALETRVRNAISDSRKISNNLESSPIAALTYERELIEIKRQLQAIEGELQTAKIQLAALMNLKPDASFRLSGIGRVGEPPVLKLDARRLIATALENRPELRDVQLKSRVNEKEATAALLELMPGLQLYAGPNYDGNSFLLNNNWLGLGAKASFNLISLFRYPARVDQIDAQAALLDQRALALTMAILTQVKVSEIRYRHYSKELATADEFLNVQGRLLAQIRAQATTEKVSEQTLIREEMNMLVAQAKRDVAYADTQTAYGNVYEALGYDPYGGFIDKVSSVHDVAAAFKRGWVGGRAGVPTRPVTPAAALVATAAAKADAPSEFAR